VKVALNCDKNISKEAHKHGLRELVKDQTWCLHSTWYQVKQIKRQSAPAISSTHIQMWVGMWSQSQMKNNKNEIFVDELDLLNVISSRGTFFTTPFPFFKSSQSQIWQFGCGLLVGQIFLVRPHGPASMKVFPDNLNFITFRRKTFHFKPVLAFKLKKK